MYELLIHFVNPDAVPPEYDGTITMREQCQDFDDAVRRIRELTTESDTNPKTAYCVRLFENPHYREEE